MAVTLLFSTAVAGVVIASGTEAAGAQRSAGAAWNVVRRHLSRTVALLVMPADRAAVRSSAL